MFRDRAGHERTGAHALALDCLEAGIRAAKPDVVVPAKVNYDADHDRLRVGDTEYDLGDVDRVLVLGGGNAAGALARELEAVIGSRLSDGAVVTTAAEETSTVTTSEGDHPVPSQRNVAATRDLLALAREAGADDLVLAVIGGGGSALMTAPREGVDLADLQAVTSTLIESGASIDEINAVRKHLSRIKGGHLAEAARPARVVGLVISDVVDDDLSVVASGPVAPDDSTFEDALGVLARYDCSVPDVIRETLEAGASGDIPETPGPADPAFDRVDTHVLASGETAITAAVEEAQAAGYEATVLSSRIQGESRDVGGVLAAIGAECAETGRPVDPPCVLVSGGETTVTVRGDGTGGPNQELALGAALDLDTQDVVLASVDTDGLDGPTDAAGAIVDAETVTDTAAAEAALQANDAYTALAARDRLLVTGETGTNVNDLRVVVVAPPPDGQRA